MNAVVSHFEFAKQHGGNPVEVDGRKIYPDGASEDGIFRSEPPLDPKQNAQARKSYVQAKLREEIDGFHRFQSDCLTAAQHAGQPLSCVAGPPHDAVQQLERGKARIAELRKQLAEIEVELGQTPAVAAKQARQQQHHARQTQLNQQVAAIRAVTID